MKNKNFQISDETHKRLKAYAAYQGVAIGEAIGILLDSQQIPYVQPGPGYREWLKKVLQVAKEDGDEAAERFMKENPYVEG